MSYLTYGDYITGYLERLSVMLNAVRDETEQFATELENVCNINDRLVLDTDSEWQHLEGRLAYVSRNYLRK